jgi:hypothetical protein
MCFALAAVLVPHGVGAQWYENGIPIGAAYYQQRTPHVAPDGEGGAFIAWDDWRKFPGDRDIYIQLVNARGEAAWTPGGIPLCDEVMDQYRMDITAVQPGCAVIAWDDLRNASHNDIYVQLVDASGPRWMPNGVPVCMAADDQYMPEVIADGEGGAIVVWEDWRSGSNRDIYAQRVDSLGNIMWAPDGVAVCTHTQDQNQPHLASDGAGGAIITWLDRRGGLYYDVYAQRVTAVGSVAWTADGEPVCTASYDQWGPRLTSDGAGGAIITWYDDRLGADSDIYVQRVDPDGDALWDTDGMWICGADSTQRYVEITSDGSGGAILTWEDARELTHGDIYAHRVNHLGAPLWGINGVRICGAAGTQGYPVIAADGSGGAIIAWTSWSSSVDVYAQRVDAYGTSLWTADGVPVCTAAGDQYAGGLAADAAGGAIIAWDDDRDWGYVLDVYAQRIGPRGHWGRRAPAIRSVDDVPGDQGGFVTVAWDASDVDTWALNLIDSYTLWRGISPVLAAMRAGEGCLVVHSPESAHIDDGAEVVRVEHLEAGGPVYWELLFSVGAYYMGSYAAEAPTLFDSTSTSSDYQYFQVVAHSATAGLFWVSEPDSGRSVDNLSPGTPLNLAGEYETPPGELLMTWDPNTEADLSNYFVYRGATEGFVPDETNRIGEPSDTFFVDTEFNPGAEEYYKLSATDIHENESGYALLRPEDISGVGPSTPIATMLEQNVPNPFSPETVIRFSIAERGHVSLKVYDVEGRPVRTLVDGERAPDRYEAWWDSRDDAGRDVAPGVYFYKLEATGYSRTMKMVMLR